MSAAALRCWWTTRAGARPRGLDAQAAAAPPRRRCGRPVSRAKAPSPCCSAATKSCKDLNRDFRGKDKPTNVLSFPAAANADGYRGDIAIAYGVTRRKPRRRASASPIMPAIWWCMACCIWPAMIMRQRRDAKVMEPLEVKILERLGIADPYKVARMSDAAADHPPLFKRLLQILRGENASSAAMRESLEEVIEESERQSPALSEQERVMLANLLAFGELKVRDVMVPRAEIVAVDETMPLPELVTLFRAAQHSRLPVYRETLDDPTGLVHVKDVHGACWKCGPTAITGWKNPPSPAIKRPVLFVPPSMRALDLLLKMQTSHTHLALVIDEYGGTDGLVSIEDIIEEIVGDIADEHDDEGMALRRDGDLLCRRCPAGPGGFQERNRHRSVHPGNRRGCRFAGRAGDVAAGPGAPARRDRHPSRRL